MVPNVDLRTFITCSSQHDDDVKRLLLRLHLSLLKAGENCHRSSIIHFINMENNYCKVCNVQLQGKGNMCSRFVVSYYNYYFALRNLKEQLSVHTIDWYGEFRFAFFLTCNYSKIARTRPQLCCSISKASVNEKWNLVKIVL